jgi:tetratricopeptide (TPR) repeat protein
LTAAGCAPHIIQEKRAERFYEKGQHLAAAGEQDKALSAFEKSLSLSKEAGFQAGVAHNYNEMGIIYTARGEYGRARDVLEKAAAIYKELAMAPEVSKSLNNLALTCLREGDYRGAIRMYEELLEWDTQTGNTLGMGIVLNNMGQVYDRYLGDTERAKEMYSRALAILSEIGNPKIISIVKKNLAAVQEKTGP